MRVTLLLFAIVALAVGAVAVGWIGWTASRDSDRVGSPDADSADRGDSTEAAGGPMRTGGLSSLKMPQANYRGAPWFRDRTMGSGIDFVHSTGTSPEKPFPAANGSGTAAIDFDLDGLPDLYFATGRLFPLTEELADPPTNRLYRNRGDWRFEDVSRQCGLDYDGYSAGLTVGDYDADGFPDVYVACFGANVLYRNMGDGTFVATVDSGAEDAGWATSAAMLDFDNDGLNDLYVCNYGEWSWETNQYCGDRSRGVRVYCSPVSIKAQKDVLLRNRGDGTFEDVSESTGIASRSARSQGVIVADFNDDRAVDLYVGNDLHANSLFMNRGDGRFEDASERSGVAYDYKGVSQAGMGVAAADMNGDGRFELLVTNFENEHNAYYENLGQGVFAEVAHSKGLAAASQPWVGWGVGFSDFDLDGRTDVVVTNGHVDDNRHLMGQTSPYAAPPLAWKNRDGRFEYLGAGAGDYFEQPHVGRSLVLADLDNDGDHDVIIGHQDAAPAILENIVAAERSARSISARLIGRRSNRDAIGAKLIWTASSVEGERQVVQQVTHGGSYLSCHDPRVLFPVLAAETAIQLVVQWPSGVDMTLDNLKPGEQLTVIEPLPRSDEETDDGP